MPTSNLSVLFSPLQYMFSLPRTMSNLYRDAEWSRKDLDKQISEARKHMTKCKINSFSLEYLKYYKKQLSQRKREGHKTSFIDLWGLVLESFLHDGVQYIIKQHLQSLTIFWKFISGKHIFLLALRKAIYYKTVQANAQLFLKHLVAAL